MLRQLYSAISMTLFMTLLTGGVFPLVVWACASLFFPYQATGSFLRVGERDVGSLLIGQSFTSARYFQPRPSAAGGGYDGLSSGGTNLAPTSRKLILGQSDDPATAGVDESFAGVVELARRYRVVNGLSPATLLPADAVTRSASGLDPHISPQNAILQATRVSKERGLDYGKVLELITQLTEPRFLGIFGEPRLNVLKLNTALDRL